MRVAVSRCAASLSRSLLSTGSINRITSHITCAHATRSTPIPYNALRSLHTSRALRQEAMFAEEQQQPSQEPALSGDITRFDQLAERDILHPTIVETLTKDMKLETMTEVQARTLAQAIKGLDLIAQAKTGTGKTLAFLMPILQNIIKLDPGLAQRNYSRRGPRTTADDIRALIISPTRELAEQIAAEAKRLVANTSVVVQCAVGGTQKSAGLRAIQREGCHILVGTPGRLHDILTDEYSRVQAPDLSCMVLDEADRLLDQGFWPAIQDIQKVLPHPEEKDRQTLLFSATVPREVVDLVRRTLKPGFEFVQCVKADEEPTHERVAQKIVVAKGLENVMPALVELCSREIEAAKQPGARPFKAIVYFASTAEVGLTNMVLNGLVSQNAADADSTGADALMGARFSGRRPHPWGRVEVSEIHAKLTQAQRTQTADRFRAAKTGILLSSDVTARGLDFPDVTHVIQVGLPPSEEQYIHRIGRTARAGKEGEGWLIVPDFDLQGARRLLGKLPLKRDDSLETASLSLDRELQVSANIGRILSMTQAANLKAPVGEKIKVYRALVGVYQRLSDKHALIAGLNALSQYGWGLEDPPSLSPALAARLGLSRVPGVRLGVDPREDDFGGRSGGRGFSGNRRDSFGSGSFDGRAGDRNSFGGRGGGGPSFGGGRTDSDYFGRGSDRAFEYGNDRKTYGGQSNSSRYSGGRGGNEGRSSF